MDWKLHEIAAIVEGKLLGDGEFRIRAVRSLEAAGPDDLTFVRGPGFFEAARASRAGALLVPAGEQWRRPVIEVDHPEAALVRLLTAVTAAADPLPPPGVHPDASVSADAEVAGDAVIEAGAIIEAGASIGPGSRVGPGAVVGRGCRLDRGVRLHGNVTLYRGVRVGDRSIIHGGSVIGADGFGYVQHEGRHVKIPHAGGVVIEEDVEIGALCTIDRGMLEDTVVRRGAKIDDHCHIAHNCIIGEASLLTGGCQLAGSVTIGRGVVLGGSTGVSDNCTIGDGARVGGRSAVFSDIPAGAEYWGSPARPAKEILRAIALFPRLPWMRRQIQRLLRHTELPADD